MSTLTAPLVKDRIANSIHRSLQAVEQLLQPENIAFVEAVAETIVRTFRQGGKLIIAGNGGSLCQAQHLAEEFTGFFYQRRPPLPAIALADSGFLSCVANDIGYEEVFARGVQAYGSPNDLFIGLTTSGNSQNLVRAFAAAKQLKMQTVAFLGREGGLLRGIATYELLIAGSSSATIQEAHMVALHLLVDQVEQMMEAQ